MRIYGYVKCNCEYCENMLYLCLLERRGEDLFWIIKHGVRVHDASEDIPFLGGVNSIVANGVEGYTYRDIPYSELPLGVTQ